MQCGVQLSQGFGYFFCLHFGISMVLFISRNLNETINASLLTGTD